MPWDGFRSLAYLENGRCGLMSRNRNEFKSFSDLNLVLPFKCRAKRAALEGEIVCLDKKGNSQFRDQLVEAPSQSHLCPFPPCSLKAALLCLGCRWPGACHGSAKMTHQG